MNISLVSSDKLEREKNNLREAITCRHCKSEHLAAVWWHCTAGVHRPASPFIPNINGLPRRRGRGRSEEHTSELQSLMRISYAVFCLNKKKKLNCNRYHNHAA